MSMTTQKSQKTLEEEAKREVPMEGASASGSGDAPPADTGTKAASKRKRSDSDPDDHGPSQVSPHLQVNNTDTNSDNESITMADEVCTGIANYSRPWGREVIGHGHVYTDV